MSATNTTSDGVDGWGAIDSASKAFLICSLGPPNNIVPYVPTGFQYPRTGNNFILSSFFCSTCGNNGRWFPKNRLKTLLKPGVEYCAQYYVVNTNNSPVGTSEYSILLEGTVLDTIKKCVNPLPYLNPQIVRQGAILTDTVNWTAIYGTFTAAGHEKYMVLGNFKSDANTHTTVINPTYLPTLSNDVYIDDVSLVEVELPAFAGSDTSIWFGDSIFIGREPDVGIDYACQWFLLPNDSMPIDTIAGMWVKPTVPSSYLVRQQLWCSGVKWDTVTVKFLTVGIYENNLRDLKIYPNPANDHITIALHSAIQQYTLTVTDISGQVLNRVYYNGQDNASKIDLPYSSGLYFATLTTPTATVTRKIIVQK